jgi:glutamyl-tRNA synthetase
MSVTVRFAPSPTGNIHIGNARTALINWLFARKNGGRYILRFDDTDIERSRREYADNIERDLLWLGIAPDQVERQSDRLDSYRVATDRLIQKGLLYPCFETPEEIERKRTRLAARGLPPIYDRAALRLSRPERESFERDDRRPHWRFLLPNFERDPFEVRRTVVSWADLARGEQKVDLGSLSDPVLLRGDGSWLYTLTSVVDDMEMGITHVIRGDDHITNTGVQIAIFEALGHAAPAFGHHNLLTSASGEGLSKRLGSLSLQSLAEACYEPMAVASLAVLVGGAGAVEPMADMDRLMNRFDIGAISRSPAKFDTAELDALNRKLVQVLPWDRARRRFEPDAFGGNGCEFWCAVRENLDRVCEAMELWDRLMTASPKIDAEDRALLTLARETLPEEPWDRETWAHWTGELRERSGRKGRALFMPLRKAITGMDRGPEMAALLPLIGRERTLARLS